MKELDTKPGKPAKDSNLIDPAVVMADAPESSGDNEERPPDVGVEN